MEKNEELKNKVFPDTPDADDSKNKKDEQDNNKADSSSSDKKLSKDENTVASQEENDKEDAKDKKSEVNEDKKNGKTEEDKNKVKAGKANDGRENVKVDSESAETPISPKGAETPKVKKDKDGEKKTDKDNEDEQTAVSDADTEEMDNNNTDNKDSSNKDNNNKEQKVPPLKLSVSGGCPVALTPTTTASTLYSVLMAPLDSRSTYTSPFAIDSDSGTRKRPRLDSLLGFGKTATESGKPLESQSTNAHSPVGMDLSKNRKRKLKKKKRKLVLNKVEVQRAKDFIYSSENEQFSVEKLRTMIEDVTEFLDAIWDVYCSEARRKNESVEEEGYKAAAVLKCLNASGEGSWGDLQLLSRAKSVLVLRSKNLAASTISRVENELGYETDIRNFIVRMLRFWMNEVVPKG